MLDFLMVSAKFAHKYLIFLRDILKFEFGLKAFIFLKCPKNKSLPPKSITTTSRIKTKQTTPGLFALNLHFLILQRAMELIQCLRRIQLLQAVIDLICKASDLLVQRGVLLHDL